MHSYEGNLVQYNLYIFGIHLWTVLYPKPCYNELCYKEVVVYIIFSEDIRWHFMQIVCKYYFLRKKKKKKKKKNEENSFMLQTAVLFIPAVLPGFQSAHLCSPARNFSVYLSYTLLTEYLLQKRLGGHVVSTPDFRLWGPGFESRTRRNSTDDCITLHCTEPFIIIL